MSWRDRFLVPWTLDLRSLALFRILLGIILILNVILRIDDVTAFYTDLGVMPRSEVPPEQRWVSVYFLGGNTQFISVLLAIQAVAAVTFLLGVSTHLSTLVNWFLLVSLHVRNPLIQHYGDQILAMLLFWGIFLPLGARWSVDAWRMRQARLETGGAAGTAAAGEQNAVVSLATAALVIQVIMIYVFSAVLKTHPQWRTDFTALRYALHLDFFITPLGQALRDQTELTWYLSLGTMILEAFVPFFLLIPWKQGPMRCLVIALFIGFHVGLIMTLYLGLFPYICIVMWLGLLPSWFWDRLLGSVTEEGRTSSAGQLHPLASAVLAVLLGFLLYDQTLAAIQGGHPKEQPPNWRSQIGLIVPIRQHWAMFAPKPMDWNGWYVVEGVLADGRRLDLFPPQVQPLQWERPEDIAKTYRNQRWRKYLNNLTYKIHTQHRKNFAFWKWREWELQHPQEPLVELRVWFLCEVLREDGTIDPVVPLEFAVVQRRVE
jgi:hypothetical protein